MPRTVANQKVIVVHRDKPKSDFLQIKKENWYAANKDLTPFGLQLYLYLAGNRDGYELALSQEAAFNDAGITKTTFHKYVNMLMDKGYLVLRHGNVYDFYEIPKKTKREEKDASADLLGEQNESVERIIDLLDEPSSSSDNKEIDNITDKAIDKKIYSEEFVF